MQYTYILHHARKQLGLSSNEYCIADMIDLLASPTAPVPGWCSASRGWMGNEMDLSRQSIITIIAKLKSKGLVNESDEHYLKTTELWKQTLSTCKESLQEGVKNLDTISSNGTFSQEQACQETLQVECQESLQGVKKVDIPCQESLQQGCKESLQGGVKKVDTYNKSIELDNNNNSTATANSAGESISDSSENLDAERATPNPQVAAAPLAPKKVYGDGELQKRLRAYFRDNPTEFPESMYPPFLEHWTEPVQFDDDHPANVGKELWRTKTTFNLRQRLGNWHNNDVKAQQKNESATRQNQPSQYDSGATHRAGSPKTSGGRPVKRTATIKPGMFNRDSQNLRHTDSDGGRTTIRIDVE